MRKRLLSICTSTTRQRPASSEQDFSALKQKGSHKGAFFIEMVEAELFGCGWGSVGRAGCSGGGLLLQRLFFAGFLDEGFAREANFVALDGKHFDHDLVAEFQLVANVADAVFRNFA